MKFKLLIVFLVLSIVLIAGCNKGPQATTTTTLPPCEGLEGPPKDKCMLDMAYAGGDLSYCEKISVGLWRDNCVREVAYSLDDPNICTQINDTFERNTCIKYIAQNLKNPKICARIVEATTAGECYFSVALYDKLNETCNAIGTDTSKFRCLAIINDDSSYCTNISNSRGRDWCYQKTLDCEKINSTSILDQCYLDLAPKKIDMEVCNLVSNSTLRSQCYKDVDIAERRRKQLEQELQDSFGNESMNLTVIPQ